MQTQLDNTREQQNATAPRILKESSTGGTATITDNRPTTVYQRKLQETMSNSPRIQAYAPLRETMRAYATSKALPVQRKAPKGSSRFQQIATAMGEQHGVDTSGLVATHNSSFPAQLNAEATIQGNKIHFAPGKDTDYTIRHEVAHAIDNTLHGTPGGDQVVNGQKVDTTREKVVDRMAKVPVNAIQDQASPFQRRKIKIHGFLQEAAAGNKDTSKYVIQRYGEQEAVEYAKSLGIRRGNRRASIKGTKGLSQALVRWMRNDFRKYHKGKLGKYLLGIFEDEDLNYNEKDVALFMEGQSTFIIAALVKAIQAGNCGEFSAVVFAHLFENTKDQWIYIADLHPMDTFNHSIVLTSKDDCGNENAAFNAPDPDNVTVVDAWYHYNITSLSDFLNKGNHHKAMLTQSNLIIQEKEISKGESPLDDAMKEYLEEFITDNMDWIKGKIYDDAVKNYSNAHKDEVPYALE